ncbi:MAG: helix-turn-helix domain-containing protein [Fimbriimonas sp.]|nr:helix-turn-helix domain-containing protein [Fimbriimonas sp.]
MCEDEEVFSSECPSRKILDQIFDKWSLLILAILVKGPRRFNSLRRCLDGVTQKALTQTLRRLERNGLVSRTVLPTSPVCVEYALTRLGETLQAPFAALYAWTIDNMDEIQTAQRTFDSRADR